MKSYTLSEEQVALAYELANKIQQSKSYTKNWKVDNIALGVMGEIAYGMMQNKPINAVVYDYRSDGGRDFFDGADIKTISYTGPNPELKLGKIPTFSRASKYVLAVCDPKQKPCQVHLIGEISFQNFVEKATMRNYGAKSWYAVNPDKLDLLYS